MTRKKRAYHHGDLRETILQFALKAIESAPPEELSLRELSRQAGVTSMALYRHFADKQALLNALADVGFAELGERMLAVEDANDAKASLVAAGVAYVAFAVERPGLFRVMYGGAPPDTPPLSDEAPHAAYAVLSRRISALAPPSQHKVAFLSCWSLVHGLATLLVTSRFREPIADPIAVAKQVCRFFIGAFD
jgi:AcrR family transcriptional regulator